MTPCLIAVNLVPEREVGKFSRSDCLAPVRPPVNTRVSDRTVRSSVNLAVAEKEEFTFIKRCILVLLLTGFLPVVVWLLLHIYSPDLLFIDITPKSEHVSAHGVNFGNTVQDDVSHR